MSFKASVEERFVHALRKACGDPDDQESTVVYGITTRLSFAAPACLSGTSSFSNCSQILAVTGAVEFVDLLRVRCSSSSVGEGCPMTYGDSRVSDDESHNSVESPALARQAMQKR